MTTPPKTERNAALVEAVERGDEIASIARAHGITPARVRQIYQRETARADAAAELSQRAAEWLRSRWDNASLSAMPVRKALRAILVREVRHLDALPEMSRADLLRIPSVTRRDVDAIESALASHGRRLRDA